MQYSAEIEINQPREKVVALFVNYDRRHEWMKGLESSELLSGQQGQPGAKTKMKFEMGKRKIEMVETIIARNLPEEFIVAYEAKQVYNIVGNIFEKLSHNKTRYITEQDFRFKGVMKFFAPLMKGSFKKQSKKNLQDFKTFVEKN